MIKLIGHVILSAFVDWISYGRLTSCTNLLNWTARAFGVHCVPLKLTVDASCNPASYDDYYPFGMIMDGRSANLNQGDTRLKFAEKERDVESYMRFNTPFLCIRTARHLFPDPRPELPITSKSAYHPLARQSPLVPPANGIPPREEKRKRAEGSS